MVTEITRVLAFDSGHRVYGHEGKCNRLHGHRYSVSITIESPMLDSVGRVFDFGWIKDRVGKWIDDNWDHRTVLNDRDPLVKLLPPDHVWLLSGQNPTAEVMAKFLFQLCERLIPEVTVKRVTLWETPACSATYPAQ